MADLDKRIAVFTSGGDAPGMNAAIRAIVRRCCNLNIEIYAIKEGYSGMIKGLEYFKKMSWSDVSGLLSKGGTIIGTSRCPEFQTKEGRINAAKNLLKLGINKLICIGGDGSLKGAHILSSEWPEIINKLYSENQITKETKDKYDNITVAGIVGSIDNDFWGTDITLGTVTAVHRITEATDSILTTALSHHRTFIIEVMGRNCGYLALMSGLAAAADYTFVAEKPTEDNWKEKLCRAIKRGRDLNRLHSIIIVSEGAIDKEGNRISVNEIKQTISEYLGFDSRITILGHVQRGGSPCAFDRLIATLFGVHAVDHLVDSKENVVVCYNQFKINYKPLLECVEKTSLITEKIESNKFKEALDLRSSYFRSALDTYMDFVRSKLGYSGKGEKSQAVAIINIGKSAPGMNAAVMALTRLLLGKNYSVYGVVGGVNGLIEGNLKKFGWLDVDSWTNIGGSLLGTKRKQPDNYLPEINKTLEKFNIKGLFIIGGWDGYTAALTLSDNSHIYPTFNMPIICIPATISNNCPGTNISIGSDTALNMIIMSCDILKQYTISSKCKVFIMEVQGGKCGYLATSALITGGCHIAYTPEKGITLQKILDDANMLINRFKRTNKMALIVYGEHSNSTYTSSKITKILNEEGKGIFRVNNLVLGDIQQGHVPTPTDRILGVDFAYRAFKVFHNAIKNNSSIHCGIGLNENGFIHTELKDLKESMDFVNRRPFIQEWEKSLIDIYGTLS